MADAQLVVYNDAGIEQVSLGGINLALVHKEVINSMASWTAISGPLAAGLTYSFTVTAVAPIVALATSVGAWSGAVFALVTNTGTNQWRIDLYGGASETGVGSVPGVSKLNANVTAYVFDEAPAPTSGPGLVLYDSTGKCTFNALYPGARVKQMLDDINNFHSYGTSVTPPAGSTYAVVQRSNWGQQIIGSRNVSTGDMLANEYRFACAGGLNGATVRFYDSTNGAYSCFINGSIAVPHGSPGDVGTVYATFGCNDGAGHYFSDGMVLDVTNF
jgi:hypothetical protein